MDERLYWLGFSAFPGVGPTRFNSLLSHFGTAKEAWKAPETDLLNILGTALMTKFTEFRQSFPFTDHYQRMKQKKVNFLTLKDESYPKLLAKSKNPPFVLYIKGNFDFSTSDPYLAVVGTRRITSYGTQVTTALVSDTVRAGCIIVSGLALGVDAVAHKTTLDQGGKTIAVLGCGVDCCTPTTNQYLYDRIIQNGGAVVSEIPIETGPTKGSFPSRNRIVAGLSLGVVVTEGAADSGALITAKDAFANGRKVFAVPGPITSDLSKGPYQLIKKGAMLVTSGEEILENLGVKGGINTQQTKSKKGDTAEEQTIIEILTAESLHFDDLVKRSKLPPSTVGSLLSLLEMKGYIQNRDNGFFILDKG